MLITNSDQAGVIYLTHQQQGDSFSFGFNFGFSFGFSVRAAKKGCSNATRRKWTKTSLPEGFLLSLPHFFTFRKMRL